MVLVGFFLIADDTFSRGLSHPAQPPFLQNVDFLKSRPTCCDQASPRVLSIGVACNYSAIEPLACDPKFSVSTLVIIIVGGSNRIFSSSSPSPIPAHAKWSIGPCAPNFPFFYERFPLLRSYTQARLPFFFLEAL